MRAVFMGKHKRSAVQALEYLVQRGFEIPAVVAPPRPRRRRSASSVSTRPPGATGCGWPSDEELVLGRAWT